MSINITTRSGSVYVVQGTTVTRLSSAPMQHRDGRVDLDGVDGETMARWGVPIVGWSWHFTTDQGRVVTTTAVTAVTVV